MLQSPSSEQGLCPRCGRPLNQASAQGLCTRCLARVAFGPELVPPRELPDSLGTLRHFGNYELIEEIARGGMGVVYRAQQVNLEREVAIKLLLHGALASTEDVERFRAEAAAAGALRHPAIVAVHEVGEHEGQHYFSMDLIAGRDLASLTRGGPLPALEAAQLLVQVSDALQHAHDQGVLHRDLKPSNVIVDPEGRPHVTDFGLARRAGLDLSLTQTGQALGTPGYMSPEQAVGRRELGPATDIYSLGALLYHLLTGRAPFTGETPTTVLRQIEEREPVSPRSLNPSTPRDLETICLKCLAKEPGRRYASASELSQDLQRFLGHEPIHARPTGLLGQAWRWCQRRRALATALGGIALLLVAITVSSTLSAYRIAALHREVSSNLYAADTRLAQQAVAESKFGVAVDLLERHWPKQGQEDLRGFEWHYLWDQCRSEEIATLGRHANQAQRAAFSPDGRWAATAATDVRIWNVSDHRLVHRFGKEAFVWALAFSPDGRRLAVDFHDLALACYDLEQGREIGTLTNLGMSPLALAWEADSPPRIRVIGSGQSLTWDPGSGTRTKQPGLPKNVIRLALSADGARGAAISTDPWQLSLWDMNTLGEIGEVSLSNAVRCVAISPNGQRLITGDFSGNLGLYEAPDLGQHRTINAHRGMIATAVFSPDSRLLATAGADQLIRVWDTSTWIPVSTLRGHRNVIFSLAFSPDQRLLISGDKNGEVKLWNVETKPSETLARGATRAILSADGAALAFTDEKGRMRVCAPAELTSNILDLTSAAIATALPITVSTNGVILSIKPGSFALLRPDGRLEANPLPNCTNNVPMHLSPNVAYLVYFPRPDLPAVWNIETARQVFQMPNPQGVTGGPAIAADNIHFALGFPNGEVRVFDIRNGRTLARFSAHGGFCYACDFSRDGRRLVTAGFDGVVKLWEMDTGKLIASFHSSADAYWAVALSPDGRRIAAGTGESAIVLWDVASGQEVASLALDGPLRPVEGRLRFTPAGDALIFAASSGWQIWRAPRPSEKPSASHQQ